MEMYLFRFVPRVRAGAKELDAEVDGVQEGECDSPGSTSSSESER